MHVVIEVAVVARPRRELQRGRQRRLGERAVRGGVGRHSLAHAARAVRQVERRREAKRGAEARERHRAEARRASRLVGKWPDQSIEWRRTQIKQKVKILQEEKEKDGKCRPETTGTAHAAAAPSLGRRC